MNELKQIGIAALAIIEWVLFGAAILLIMLSFWYGIKVEIGQPESGGLHVSLEIYGANRLFK